MGKNNPPPVYGGPLGDLIALGFGGVTEGRDIIFGLGGNDVIDAAGGNDSVRGGDDNDTIFGRAGNDRLYGDNGHDFIYGGLDNDHLFGGAGNDELYGEEGNDKLQGGSGNDTLDGGIGNDTLYGNKGSNVLNGGEGDDLVNSGDNTSVLDGGADDDTLVLRGKKGGDHIATGGTGSDEFEFVFMNTAPVSDMTITDFDLTEDGFSVEGVDDALYLSLVSLALGENAMTENGDGDAVLHLTTGDSITFEGLSEADFEAHYGLNF